MCSMHIAAHTHARARPSCTLWLELITCCCLLPAYPWPYSGYVNRPAVAARCPLPLPLPLPLAPPLSRPLRIPLPLLLPLPLPLPLALPASLPVTLPPIAQGGPLTFQPPLCDWPMVSWEQRGEGASVGAGSGWFNALLWHMHRDGCVEGRDCSPE